jgi:hypothetical protein
LFLEELSSASGPVRRTQLPGCLRAFAVPLSWVNHSINCCFRIFILDYCLIFFTFVIRTQDFIFSKKFAEISPLYFRWLFGKLINYWNWGTLTKMSALKISIVTVQSHIFTAKITFSTLRFTWWHLPQPSCDALIPCMTLLSHLSHLHNLHTHGRNEVFWGNAEKCH